MAKEQEEFSEEDLINNAVKAGLQVLISQPGMERSNVFITHNLDREKIYSAVDEIKSELENRKITSPKEQYKIIYKGIASYVASGNALNDKGKKILLEKSYKGKLDQGVLEKLVSVFKPNKFEGQKYFEKASNAYRDMYDILSQDEVAQQEIPELTKAAKAMKMYGFLDTALNIFKTHGMMDEKLYKQLSQELYQKTTEKAHKGMKGIEEYIMSKDEVDEKKEMYQKAAVLIMGIFGVILIMTNIRMTGAVIGNISNVTLGIFGMGLAATALLIFLKNQKKETLKTEYSYNNKKKDEKKEERKKRN
ncbi:MAG TPA: hypothetical protein PK357_01415 [Candidatus Pacearchaeota archaeon]|nr:hypothetical protein [Candidatus Pacearchaeota archaeon]